MTATAPEPRTRPLEGRVALVTGSGRGLGLAVVRRFLADGAKVVVHGRTPHAAADQVRMLGGADVIAVSGDLGCEADRAAMFAAVVANAGRIDVLVNNAAVQRFDAIATGDASGLRATLEVNLVAAIDCMRRAVALMVHDGDRSIVNIASIRASRPGAGSATYAASKAALVAATRAAAVELGPRGIRVNAVSPGLLWRDGLDEAWPEGTRQYRDDSPLRRVGTVDEVADACAFLASPAARWITGVDLIVDGGFSLVH